MLYHPHTLTLLTKFKETNEETLLKEILGLLIDSQSFTDFKTKLYKDFYKIIFSHSEIKKSKRQNIKKLNEIINTQFDKIENENKEFSYVLKDFEGINPKGKQLIKKNRKQKKNLNKNESELDDVILDKKSKEISEILTSFYTICDLIDCDKIYNDNKNLITNIISKLLKILDKMNENGIITKKEYLNILNIKNIKNNDSEKVNDTPKRIKSNDTPKKSNDTPKKPKDTPKKSNDTPKKLNDTPKKSNDTPNLSLLNFVTKEKKINNDFDNDKNFNPIIFDSSVYVYKLNNPNFESLRKRKDLVNPKKMMFIKFTEDIKPPIYKPTENKLKHKISYQKIFTNVDYDEESTWEDDPDAESIDSVETEEDDSSSENNEFIEADSGEQERIKIKKPTMIYPNVKIEFNEEFDKIFWELPLKPVKEISEEIKIKLENELKNVDESQNFIKRLSKKYMVIENRVKEVYEALK